MTRMPEPWEATLLGDTPELRAQAKKTWELTSEGSIPPSLDHMIGVLKAHFNPTAPETGEDYREQADLANHLVRNWLVGEPERARGVKKLMEVAEEALSIVSTNLEGALTAGLSPSGSYDLRSELKATLVLARALGL